MNNDNNEKLELDEGIKTSFGDRFNRSLKDWLIDIVIALMLIVYVLKTLVTIEVTSSDILGIIGDGLLMLVFLMSIKSLMLRKGIFTGEKTEGYIKTKARYEEQLLKIMPKSQYLAEYTSMFNAREQKEKLTRILAQYGVSYEQYIKGIENPTKAQETAIKAANKAKYLRITVTDLTGSGVTDEKKPGLGKTKNEFLKTKSVTDISITLLSMVIFSVFTFKLAGNFSWANLIWTVMQCVVFLIKGTMSFMSAYVFVTDEYTNRLIRQTNMLIDFDNTDLNVFESKREADRLEAEEEARIQEELDERNLLKLELAELKVKLELAKLNERESKKKCEDGQAPDHEEQQHTEKGQMSEQKDQDTGKEEE